MHSRSFAFGEGSSIDRIPFLLLPCNLSSRRPDTRQETKPAKMAGFGSAGVGRFPGNSIRLPAQVQVRYLHLFFERLFTRPADQPRHAVCSSNHQSKPVHPRFAEHPMLRRQSWFGKGLAEFAGPGSEGRKGRPSGDQKMRPSVGSSVSSTRSTWRMGRISPSSFE